MVVWAFFGIAFHSDWNENWPFPVLWPLWVFQICWHIECSTFIASPFRIWNSSTGIPSPPLALFRVMLPKAHLTSHSRMSGSRCVITPSWLSESWRSFCMVLLCILATSCYNIFCFCWVHTISVLYCAHFSMKCSISSFNFFEKISSLSYFVIFIYFFAVNLTRVNSWLLAIPKALPITVWRTPQSPNRNKELKFKNI